MEGKTNALFYRVVIVFAFFFVPRSALAGAHARNGLNEATLGEHIGRIISYHNVKRIWHAVRFICAGSVSAKTDTAIE